eukprot:CAMPEP_0181357416 /NCGR_PEP_ID=MMETSP1106-20121128/4954_1 /TAXON_ID=81844 /ORGANISM="Mantoniella antarctica, Strain SL-175" /LENGTH=57 /DNA_ID=CAMNT_0023470287 /DNA_START=224 /DNA_END=394 /DNA_ORIENTATION=+
MQMAITHLLPLLLLSLFAPPPLLNAKPSAFDMKLPPPPLLLIGRVELSWRPLSNEKS